MPPRNKDRDLALEEGRLHYTGMPCKKCGNTLRYVNNGGCVDCCKDHTTEAKLRAAKNYSTSKKGREHQKKQRQKRVDYQKGFNLQKLYGITLDDYNKMLTEQNHSCKICERHVDEFDRTLAVDHCHTTGKVRGLLCSNCNTALGLMKEDVGNIMKMVEYVSRNAS